MKARIVLTLLGFAISASADEFADALTGGSDSRGAKKPPTSYRSKAQDAAYNKTIKDIDTNYGKQTTAVNSPKYDSYLSKLDSTYDAMVNDINKGGSGRTSGELPKYQPEKVEGTTTASSTGSKSGTTSPNTSADGKTTTSTEKTDEEKKNADPVIAEILTVCPRICNSNQDYSCASDCALAVVLEQRDKQEREEASTLLALMVLLGD